MQKVDKKQESLRCWRGYLSAAWCKCFVHITVDVVATSSSFASLKPRKTYLSCARPEINFTVVVIINIYYY